VRLEDGSSENHFRQPPLTTRTSCRPRPLPAALPFRRWVPTQAPRSPTARLTLAAVTPSFADLRYASTSLLRISAEHAGHVRLHAANTSRYCGFAGSLLALGGLLLKTVHLVGLSSRRLSKFLPSGPAPPAGSSCQPGLTG
jgi:hypothetical protein